MMMWEIVVAKNYYFSLRLFSAELWVFRWNSSFLCISLEPFGKQCVLSDKFKMEMDDYHKISIQSNYKINNRTKYNITKPQRITSSLNDDERQIFVRMFSVNEHFFFSVWRFCIHLPFKQITVETFILLSHSSEYFLRKESWNGSHIKHSIWLLQYWTVIGSDRSADSCPIMINWNKQAIHFESFRKGKVSDRFLRPQLSASALNTNIVYWVFCELGFMWTLTRPLRWGFEMCDVIMHMHGIVIVRWASYFVFTLSSADNQAAIEKKPLQIVIIFCKIRQVEWAKLCFAVKCQVQTAFPFKLNWISL